MTLLFNPLMRVLLAMYLAVWTPAMCCCAIKSALGGESCNEVAKQQLPACCAKLEASTCCDEGPGQSETSDRSDCRCHEKSVDRLDTGSKLVLIPAAFQVGTLEWIGDGGFLAAPALEHGGSVNRRAHPPPRVETLLSLRTLLLI